MTKSFLGALAVVVLSLTPSAARSAANLLANGDFGRGFASWGGNSYAGGEGSVGVAYAGSGEDEQSFARLTKTRGPGGAQMFQTASLPKGVDRLRFAFRAKGCPSNVYVKFLRADGRTPFLDSRGQPAQAKVVFSGAQGWTPVSATLQVPAAAQADGGRVVVHFGILGGATEVVLCVDDVVLSPEQAETSAPAPLTFAFAPTPAPDET